jgi:nanoRNase/pAp phosphatase (c-di-AMP/oligoRNAs hydrolase)
MFQINKIIKKIEEAKNILVVCSRPIDEDCLGTSLNISNFLREKYQKQVRHVSFHLFPSKYSDYPLIKTIEIVKDVPIDLQDYGLIILSDGSDWGQFFGSDYEKFMPEVNLDNVILIDHHELGSVNFDINNANSLVITSASCAAEVLYYEVFKLLNFEPDKVHIELLYRALIADTLRFEHSTSVKTFQFAAELLERGANHSRVVDESYDWLSFKFMSWAIDNLKLFDDIKLNILKIGETENDELDKLIKPNWFSLSVHKAFTNLISKKINGYDYHLMFRFNEKRNGIDAGWRTKNYGDHIAIIDVLRAVGFEGGGHFGAGGAFLEGEKDVDSVVRIFVEEMRKVVLSSGF